MNRDSDLSGCVPVLPAPALTDMLPVVGYEAEESETQSSESSAGPILKNPGIM